uniref:Chemosensory protein 10 n=1 Tax=Grapholita molesta TaxID=192188 RepID=A0A5J6K9A3_GRAMO|nr:chemosensory protein 10 [Grapholita molesta]
MTLSIVIALCLFAVAVGRSQGKYTDKFDIDNIDEVLKSERLLKAYADCLMDRGRCSPDAKGLKVIVPEALENECYKCTEMEKQGAAKVIRNLVNEHPDIWKDLSSKYDPDNIYFRKYKNEFQIVIA